MAAQRDGGGTTDAAVQYFERGLMIWREDTGMIVAFGYDGTALSYPLHRYTALPDNPQIMPLRTDPTRPILGMGKVWGNFAEVRRLLGMPIEAERAYSARYAALSGRQGYLLQDPNGQMLQVYPNNTWAYADSSVITETGTNSFGAWIPATFQPFENGLMIWNGETGDVYVYVGSQNGSLSVYNARSYGELPINASLPPAGYYSPIMGFGRVWANLGSYRTLLGWGLASEQSYQMLLALDGRGIVTSITLPDQRRITRNNDGSYTLPAGLLFQRPRPTAAYPTPERTPVILSSSMVAMAIQCFEYGFMIWRADTGMVYVLIRRTSIPDTGYVYAIPQSSYVTSAPATNPTVPPNRIMPVSAFAQTWWYTFDIRQEIGWGTQAEQGYTGTVTTYLETNVTYLGIPSGGSVSVNLNTAQWNYSSLGNTYTCPSI
jgi:hypothetical protein